MQKENPQERKERPSAAIPPRRTIALQSANFSSAQVVQPIFAQNVQSNLSGKSCCCTNTYSHQAQFVIISSDIARFPTISQVNLPPYISRLTMCQESEKRKQLLFRRRNTKVLT